MTSAPASLSTCLSAAVSEFFSANALPGKAAAGDSPKTGDIIAATLGFSGAKMRGSLLLLCTDATLLATHPMREMMPEIPASDLADWAGEIANQVVGNLKRVMASSAKVDFLLGTPTVVKGVDVHQARGSAATTEVFAIGWNIGAPGAMSFAFAVELDSSVSFSGASESSQAQGGDAMLF